MNLGFKVKLDTDHEAGVLELAVVVNGTLEEVSDGSVGGAGETGHGERVTEAAVLVVGVVVVDGLGVVSVVERRVGVAGAERVVRVAAVARARVEGVAGAGGSGRRVRGGGAGRGNRVLGWGRHGCGGG